MAATTLLILCLAIAPIFGNTPKPWIFRPDSENQYQFNNDETSWTYTRERCRAQNADLVSINDAIELEWLMSHYHRPAPNLFQERHILVGSLQDKNNNWVWVDGSELNTTTTSLTPSLIQPQGCAQWEVQGGYLNKVTGTCDGRSGLYLITRYICERTPEQYRSIAGVAPGSGLPHEVKNMKALQNHQDVNCKEGLGSDCSV